MTFGFVVQNTNLKNGNTRVVAGAAPMVAGAHPLSPATPLCAARMLGFGVRISTLSRSRMKAGVARKVAP